MIKQFSISLLLILELCSARASDGLLNATYEEVAAMLGKSTSQDKGEVSGIKYERHHFQTNGWKTAVLFIDGKAQKLETEKMDGSSFTAEEQQAVFGRYDLPNSAENSKIKGWRSLTDAHFIRGDGRVHIVKRGIALIVFLDDLPRDFW